MIKNIAGQIIAAVRPQISPLRLAFPRVQLANRRFIGMQTAGMAQMFHQTIHQGREGDPQLTDPGTHRPAREHHPLTLGHLLQPIQGQMIEILGQRHIGQEARGRQATIDDRRGTGAA